MNFTFPENCGNSPKAQFLIEFNRAFVKGDVVSILEMVEDDISWCLVGNKKIKSKEAFEKELKTMAESPMTTMEIFEVITHGKAAAVNGLLTGSDGKVYEFCDVYTFRSAGAKKISKIRSFIIQGK